MKRRIGVASYGALGLTLSSTSNCLNFLVTSEPHAKLWHWTLCGSLLSKKILAYSLVTVYCMNFAIFLCITLKLFFLSFVRLFAPNPILATPLKRRAFSLWQLSLTVVRISYSNRALSIHLFQGGVWNCQRGQSSGRRPRVEARSAERGRDLGRGCHCPLPRDGVRECHPGKILKFETQFGAI